MSRSLPLCVELTQNDGAGFVRSNICASNDILPLLLCLSPCDSRGCCVCVALTAHRPSMHNFI